MAPILLASARARKVQDVAARGCDGYGSDTARGASDARRGGCESPAASDARRGGSDSPAASDARRAARASENGDRSSEGRPSSAHSATASPIAGECLKPWPEQAETTSTRLWSGWRSITNRLPIVLV